MKSDLWPLISGSGHGLGLQFFFFRLLSFNFRLRRLPSSQTRQFYFFRLRPSFLSDSLLYRAVAAGYHQGERTNTGHYWALVRGMEPGQGAQPGYRRCNDAVCTSGEDLDRGASGLKWADAEASRRVILVALERVDSQRARRSLSEKDNELGRSVQ